MECVEFNVLSNVKPEDSLIKWFCGEPTISFDNQTLPAILKSLKVFESTASARAAGHIKLEHGFSEIHFKKRRISIFILHDPIA